MLRAPSGERAAKIVTEAANWKLLSTAISERRLDKMVEQSFPASDPLPGPIALG